MLLFGAIYWRELLQMALKALLFQYLFLGPIVRKNSLQSHCFWETTRAGVNHKRNKRPLIATISRQEQYKQKSATCLLFTVPKTNSEKSRRNWKRKRLQLSVDCFICVGFRPPWEYRYTKRGKQIEMNANTTPQFPPLAFYRRCFRLRLQP